MFSPVSSPSRQSHATSHTTSVTDNVDKWLQLSNKMEEINHNKIETKEIANSFIVNLTFQELKKSLLKEMADTEWMYGKKF